MHEAARWGNEDIMRLLLEDIRGQHLLNHHLCDGNTPLLTATRHSNTAAVQILLEYGADTFHQDPQSGDTVLHYAARLTECAVINILLALNLPLEFVNATNKFGESLDRYMNIIILCRLKNVINMTSLNITYVSEYVWFMSS